MDMDTSKQNGGDRVLTAVRLGWLTVEAFGRLRRYARAKGRGRRALDDSTKRFSFSDRSLTRKDELLLATDQLRHTTAKLVPDLDPTLPTSEEDLQRWLTENDMEALWREFEDWSKQVWNVLAIEDELAGRAFTYAGSLADTYWGAEARGPDALPPLLRSQRLEYIADRFDGYAGHLPPYSGDVLRHSLYQWRIEHELKAWDTEKKQRVLKRLESQAGVWYDLLFGRRSAESYLTPADRRLVLWGALAATAVLVLAVSILVWFGVLLLGGVGRSLLASATDVSEQLSAARAGLVEELFKWQNWSALLATLSAVVVVIIGLIKSASGWVIDFHTRTGEWLKKRLIRRRAYRRWGD
jgi:hypothetical protein